MKDYRSTSSHSQSHGSLLYFLLVCLNSLHLEYWTYFFWKVWRAARLFLKLHWDFWNRLRTKSMSAVTNVNFIQNSLSQQILHFRIAINLYSKSPKSARNSSKLILTSINHIVKRRQLIHLKKELKSRSNLINEEGKHQRNQKK